MITMKQNSNTKNKSSFPDVIKNDSTYKSLDFTFSYFGKNIENSLGYSCSVYQTRKFYHSTIDSTIDYRLYFKERFSWEQVRKRIFLMAHNGNLF